MTEAEEIAALRKQVEALSGVVRRIYADKMPDTWFVSGELGEKDGNGLPERITVCPAYGCDWVQVYQRTDQTAGPEW